MSGASRVIRHVLRGDSARTGPLPDDLPVFVAVDKDSTHSKRTGVRVFREQDLPGAVALKGLRVASVPETLLACARDLCLLDLIVLTDSALQQNPCTLAELQAVARRRRGAPRLRRALGWCHGGSESAWESLLRILHVACGIPVEPQAVLRDADGGFVARADLLVVGTRTLQEYDGADHLDRRQYGKDRRRDSRISGAGFTRHGWVSEQVLTRGVGILREADLALGRAHDPGLIKPWHDLLRASLFTEAGTAAFRARIGLPSEDAPERWRLRSARALRGWPKAPSFEGRLRTCARARGTPRP